MAFLMEHEHFTYPEAIRYLAKKYQIEIEETEQSDEQKEKASERESMYLVSEYAREFFSKSLWETEAGKAIGLSYFKERWFTEETIRNFGSAARRAAEAGADGIQLHGAHGYLINQFLSPFYNDRKDKKSGLAVNREPVCLSVR